MASYVKLAAEAGDKYLTALSEFQDTFLKSVATGAERFKAATLPTAPPAFELPPVPSAQEISEANFAFAQKLLKQQKSFVEKLLATATPATP
jgi:hypothetical protein